MFGLGPSCQGCIGNFRNRMLIGLIGCLGKDTFRSGNGGLVECLSMSAKRRRTYWCTLEADADCRVFDLPPIGGCGIQNA